MQSNNPWRKQRVPLNTNWVDAYAPTDKKEANYFYGQRSNRETIPAQIESIATIPWTAGVIVVLLLMFAAWGGFAWGRSNRSQAKSPEVVTSSQTHMP